MNHQWIRSASAALALLALAACSNPDAAKRRHVERGDQYVAEKRDDFAVIEYANAVRLDPKFGEARLKLAQTYERMQNLRAAFPEFIRAADALPHDRDVQVKALELLLLARRFEDAQARADAFLTTHPGDIEVVLLQANALAGLKSTDKALETLEEVLAEQPEETRALVQFGAVKQQAGDRQAAEAAFKKAIAVNPDDVVPHLAYASFLTTTGRRADAEAALRTAIRLKPTHLLGNRMLADLYTATGRLGEAEAPLKVIVEASGLPEAKFQLVDYYVTAKRTRDATALLTELAANRETFAQAETKLATLEYESGQRTEGHARLDKVLATLPNDSRALAQKARWLAGERKLDEALTRAKAAVAADPQSGDAHYTLGLVHDERRELTDAAASYAEALRHAPGLTRAQVALSRLNLLGGDSAVALRYAQEAKQTAPGEPAPRVALARSLLDRGDLNAAEKEVAVLLRILPEWPGTHAVNGLLQFRRRNVAAARAAFERALSLEPGHLEAVAGLVALDVQARQIDAALQRLDAELGRTPDRPELLLIAGRVYLQAKRPDRAEAALRKAVNVDPRLMVGYGMLAQLYINQQQLEKARAEFEGMAARDPKAVGPRTMVGIILERQGKRDEAIGWYERIVGEHLSAPVAANNLAFLYAEEGKNLDRALQLATAAKQELPENAEVDDTLGWVYVKKDLASLGVAPLEASQRRNPENATILYHLGVAYAKTGEVSKAREALERALRIDPAFEGAADARRTLTSLSS